MASTLRSLYLEYRRRRLQDFLLGIIEYNLQKILQAFPFIYWIIAPRYYRWRCSNGIHSYDCPPDPFKIEYVDPECIQYETGREHPHTDRRKLFGAVQPGTWDRSCDILSEDRVKDLREHFFEDKPWEETETYRINFQKVHEKPGYAKRKFGKEPAEVSSEDILQICHLYDEIYNSINVNGYLSQSELADGYPEPADDLFLETLDEVTVDIGRDGDLLFVDGLHRLKVAKALNIQKIPVVFLVRHKKWMEYREELCNGDSNPDHPDLRDLG